MVHVWLNLLYSVVWISCRLGDVFKLERFKERGQAAMAFNCRQNCPGIAWGHSDTSWTLQKTSEPRRQTLHGCSEAPSQGRDVDKNEVLKSLQRLRKDAGATPERFELHALELMGAWGVEDGQAAVERLKEVVSTLPPAERDILTMSLGLTNGKGVGLQQRRQHYLTRGRKYATSDSDLYRKERDATDALVEALMPTVEEMLSSIEWLERQEDGESAGVVLSFFDGQDNSPLTPEERARLEEIAARGEPPQLRPMIVTTVGRYSSRRHIFVATAAPGETGPTIYVQARFASLKNLVIDEEFSFAVTHEDGHESYVEFLDGTLVITSPNHNTPKQIIFEMKVKEAPIGIGVPKGGGSFAAGLGNNVRYDSFSDNILMKNGGKLIFGDQEWVETLIEQSPGLKLHKLPNAAQ